MDTDTNFRSEVRGPDEGHLLAENRRCSEDEVVEDQEEVLRRECCLVVPETILCLMVGLSRHLSQRAVIGIAGAAESNRLPSRSQLGPVEL